MRSRRRKSPEAQPSGGRSLRAQLFDDEDVVMVARPGRLATLPRYLATLGLYGPWRKRDTSVLTDQRILLGKGILRREERSIPLDRVHDVTLARRGLYSYVDLTIDQQGRSAMRRIGPITPSSAHRFAKEILRRR